MLVDDRFIQFIEEQGLFTRADRILLAVSGGRDSVLMAHLFARLGQPFGIAHCNFQLRGEASTADENLVRQLAAQFEVPFHVKHFDTRQYAEKERLSIQLAARELRYQWFEEIRRQGAYQYVALAHHQNDVVETMLLNLVRGTGISGLHGILPKRNTLLRPLLFLDREEVNTLVNELQLTFRDDASNFSTKYARNKIRLEVVPKLKELNPALEQTFSANGKRFEELEELLFSHTATLRENLFISDEKGVIRIALQQLQQLKPLRTLLYELFRPFQFSAAVLDDLVQTWGRADRSGRQFFSGSHRLTLDRDDIYLEIVKDSPLQAPSVYLSPGEQQRFGHYQVQLSTIMDRTENLDPKDYDKKGLVILDADQLSFPICIRNWIVGDRFQPLGMKGKKKISDFFISMKIPDRYKPEIPLFCNRNGDILWVAPYRIDERYKITRKTKKVITLGCLE